MKTIYGVPFSVHTRKVILTVMLKGMAYKIDPVIPFRPPEDWRSLSPTGLIPAMRDGDFSLADSSAICLYLEREKPTPSILPKDNRHAGQAMFIDAYAGGTVFRNLIHGLFGQKVVRPKILNQPTDQAVVDALLADVRPAIFGYLDGIAAGGDYLVGNALTIADLAVVSNLVNYSYLGLRIDSRMFPKLAGYFDRRIRSEPFHTALKAEQSAVDQLGLDRSFLN